MVLTMSCDGQTAIGSVLIEGGLALIFGTSDVRFSKGAEGERVVSLRCTTADVNVTVSAPDRPADAAPFKALGACAGGVFRRARKGERWHCQ